ncbi:transposase family protein [Streptomyces sp. NPDC006641]|uniref:transposase family protein n=1 Tax=Streptomyces sp. NPDC006641 TaxID=3364755 RepID=UPI003689A416
MAGLPREARRLTPRGHRAAREEPHPCRRAGTPLQANPAAGAACPGCGCFSGRVHDRFQCRLKDLPLAEQGFVIRLAVRRFIRGSADRPRRTFVEPFSRLAAPHARFGRLNHALE